MANPDPKPGRWILPILIAGLVGLTYAFVTNVPQSPATTSTTLAVGGTATTVTTTLDPADTTTTTLDPEIAQFNAEADSLASTAAQFADTASSVNEQWEASEVAYGPTRNALQDLVSETNQFNAAVGIVTVPGNATSEWEAIATAGEAMAAAADKMLDGLVNLPGPERRQQGLIDFLQATDDLRSAVDAAKAAAAGA